MAAVEGKTIIQLDLETEIETNDMLAVWTDNATKRLPLKSLFRSYNVDANVVIQTLASTTNGASRLAGLSEGDRVVILGNAQSENGWTVDQQAGTGGLYEMSATANTLTLIAILALIPGMTAAEINSPYSHYIYSTENGWHGPYQPAVQNNLQGSTDPNADDDASDGYAAGSIWINQTPDPAEVWRCVDATNAAAVWIKTTLTIDELATVATTNDYDDLDNKPTIPAGALASKDTIDDAALIDDGVITSAKLADLDTLTFDDSATQAGTKGSLIGTDTSGRLLYNTFTVTHEHAVSFKADEADNLPPGASAFIGANVLIEDGTVASGSWTISGGVATPAMYTVAAGNNLNHYATLRPGAAIYHLPSPYGDGEAGRYFTYSTLGLTGPLNALVSKQPKAYAGTLVFAGNPDDADTDLVFVPNGSNVVFLGDMTGYTGAASIDVASETGGVYTVTVAGTTLTLVEALNLNAGASAIGSDDDTTYFYDGTDWQGPFSKAAQSDFAQQSTFPSAKAGVLSGMDATITSGQIALDAGSFLDNTGKVRTFNSTFYKGMDSGAWSAGSGGLTSGNLDGVMIGVAQTVYVFGLVNDTTGLPDIGYSTSLTPSAPSGYTLGPIIQRLYTSGPGALYAGKVYGVANRFVPATPTASAVTLGVTTRVTHALPVPPNTLVDLRGIYFSPSPADSGYVYLSDTSQTDVAASASMAEAYAENNATSFFGKVLRTNGSSQVYARSSGAGMGLTLNVQSWAW